MVVTKYREGRTGNCHRGVVGRGIRGSGGCRHMSNPAESQTALSWWVPNRRVRAIAGGRKRQHKMPPMVAKCTKQVIQISSRSLYGEAHMANKGHITHNNKELQANTVLDALHTALFFFISSLPSLPLYVVTAVSPSSFFFRCSHAVLIC